MGIKLELFLQISIITHLLHYTSIYNLAYDCVWLLVILVVFVQMGASKPFKRLLEAHIIPLKHTGMFIFLYDCLSQVAHKQKPGLFN